MAIDVIAGIVALLMAGISVIFRKQLTALEFILYWLTGIFLIASRVFLRVNLTVCFVMIGLTAVSFIVLFILILKKKVS